MVNRGIVVLFVGLVAGAAGVGILVGLQLDDGAGGAPTATATATPADAARQTATPTPTPGGTVAPDSFDEAAIEAEIRAMINDERRSRGIGELGSLDALRSMARFHSDNMANQSYPSHDAGGFTTAGRYERFDLADRCKVVDDTGTSIREDRELETVAKTIAGRTYGDDGRINRNEREVARAVVASWFADGTARQRLTMTNAERIGVGVTVAADGGVYATADLC